MAGPAIDGGVMLSHLGWEKINGRLRRDVGLLWLPCWSLHCPYVMDWKTCTRSFPWVLYVQYDTVQYTVSEVPGSFSFSHFIILSREEDEKSTDTVVSARHEQLHLSALV